MQEHSLIFLIAGFVAASVIVLWIVLFVQPRWLKEGLPASADEAWNVSGFAALRTQGFVLYMITPAKGMWKTELVVLDEFHRELGRYFGNIRSATIQCGRNLMHLYIQGSGLNRTKYYGKVGGSAKNTIVIRNDRGLIAEIWRQNAFPPIHYRMVANGISFQVQTGGWLPSSFGSIECNGRQIGAFSRPSMLTLHTLIALKPDIPDEIKMSLCSLTLLN